MPLLKNFGYEGATIAVWLLTEPWHELYGRVSLNECDRITLGMITRDSRKREFLVVRLLVNGITGKNCDILYDEKGSPYLKDDPRHLSITHSQDIAAIILSDIPCGIDAERKDRRISDVAPRYMSDSELDWTSKSANRELACLYCWCCKEAVFKMMGIQGVDFRKSIRVTPAEISGEIHGHVWFQHDGNSSEFTVTGEFLPDNLIVWSLMK